MANRNHDSLKSICQRDLHWGQLCPRKVVKQRSWYDGDNRWENSNTKLIRFLWPFCQNNPSLEWFREVNGYLRALWMEVAHELVAKGVQNPGGAVGRPRSHQHLGARNFQGLQETSGRLYVHREPNWTYLGSSDKAEGRAPVTWTRELYPGYVQMPDFFTPMSYLSYLKVLDSTSSIIYQIVSIFTDCEYGEWYGQCSGSSPFFCLVTFISSEETS